MVTRTSRYGLFIVMNLNNIVI